MRRVAIYLRTSTDMQTNGLDAQLRALKGYCEQRGIIDYLIFEDAGFSGSKASRPGLDNLISQVRQGSISSVVVYSFSRFARSTAHLILALQEFQSLNVSFVSVTESIDTSTPIGRTVFAIIASIAELERELICERVRNGMKAAKARGKQIGIKKTYDNSEVFFELHRKGLSSRQIAKVLQCSQTTVVRILKSNEPKTAA